MLAGRKGERAAFFFLSFSFFLLTWKQTADRHDDDLDNWARCQTKTASELFRRGGVLNSFTFPQRYTVCVYQRWERLRRRGGNTMCTIQIARIDEIETTCVPQHDMLVANTCIVRPSLPFFSSGSSDLFLGTPLKIGTWVAIYFTEPYRVEGNGLNLYINLSLFPPPEVHEAIPSPISRGPLSTLSMATGTDYVIDKLDIRSTLFPDAVAILRATRPTQNAT